MLEYALQYAARGWRVIPLHHMLENGRCSCGRDCGKNKAKHPKTRNGVKDATTDLDVIRHWWRRWPHANIGVATGSGLVIIDIDGPEGLNELAALCKAYEPLPKTLVSRTGRGIHIWLAGDLQGSKKVGELLIRGEGGYCVAPPSLHASGRRYEWLENVPLSAFPNWLCELSQTIKNNKTTLLVDWSVLGPVPSYLAGGETDVATRAGMALKLQATDHEYHRIEAALLAIPASCGRDEWLRVGMALHSLRWERPDGTDRGFEIWDRWSSTCPDKYTLYACEVAWNSFRRGGITIATLFHTAHAHGWRGEVPSGPAGTIQKNFNPSSGPGSPGPAGGAPVSSNQDATDLFGNPIGNDLKANGTPALPASLTSNSAQAIVFPDTDRNGRPLPTCGNTIVAIAALGIDCAHDTFHDKLSIGGHAVAQYAGAVTDYAVHAVRTLVRDTYGFDPSTMTTFDATVQAALVNAYDPVVEYLDELAWDGVLRLETWLARYMHAETSELNASIGKLSLVAAVRRARHPGTKFDQIIVLEGPEGRGKSLAIETMAGRENFTDQPILNLGAREQMEAMQGVWLYEIAELSGMKRAEVEHIKTFASRTVDRARPAYGRMRLDRPRRTVFFATTNDDRYLRSQTGNRRFWPVRVNTVDLAGLARDRNQLWAEAAALEQQGLSIVLPERLWGAAAIEQEERRVPHPWEDLLAGIEGQQNVHEVPNGDGRMEWRVTTRDLMERFLRLEPNQMSEASYSILANVMRHLKWEGPEPLKINGKAHRGYWKIK